MNELWNRKGFQLWERKQLCQPTLETGRSSLLGRFQELTSKPTPSWSDSKELTFASWDYLSLPMRIIFASAQMVWSNCWGAGCDYGVTQIEVEIWQPSSVFDLCRQLKESPSGFKVQKDVYADQTSRAVVRSALFLQSTGCLCSLLVLRLQRFLPKRRRWVPLLFIRPVLGWRCRGRGFLLVPSSLFPLSPNP